MTEDNQKNNLDKDNSLGKFLNNEEKEIINRSSSNLLPKAIIAGLIVGSASSSSLYPVGP